jgi:CheY-like chemotaxis protein
VTVYLVDDDQGVLKGLSRLLRVRNYQVKPYSSSSPQLFLEEHDAALPGCAVLDVSMPGLDGLVLQRALAPPDGYNRPVVFITGKGDTAGARQRLPVRFDLTLQRGASWALCMGLMVISIWYLLPPPLDPALPRSGSA